MFKVGYVLPYMILLVIILVSICIISASNKYLKTKPNPRIRIGLGGIPFEENKYYFLHKKDIEMASIKIRSFKEE